MIIGNYELGPEIGVGGMGSVHRGRQLSTGAPVAIKRIHERFAGQSQPLRRFAIEVQTCSRLRHPNIVPVIDSGQEPRGTPFCVMEWVQGAPLSEWSRARLDWRHLRWMVSDLLNALAYAHARGVVHRDLKPANILIEAPYSAQPRVRLVDFGVARLMEPDSDEESDVTLTRTDRVVGTPAYLSPEQALGHTHLIGPHTDLYSLGIILWELVAGELPFQDTEVLNLLTAHATTPAPALDLSARPDVPPQVAEGIEHLLLKSQDDRPQSAMAFRAELGLPDRVERQPLPERSGGPTVLDEATEVDSRRSDLGTGADSSDRGPAPRSPVEPSTTTETYLKPLPKWSGEPAELLGRETEVAQLLDLAQSVSSDRWSRMALVHGDTGIGTSRLVREVRAALEERGDFKGARLVCRAGGSEEDAVRSLLARMLLAERITGSKLTRRLEAVAPIYQLNPLHVRALEDWLGGESEARDVGDRIDVAAQILRRLASRAPLALVLEGVDADSASFALAVFENLFGDGDTDAILFILATSRVGPGALSGPLREIYDLLSREGLAFEMPLEPLPESVVAEMVRPLVGANADEIASRAQGSPLHAIELARLRAGVAGANIAARITLSGDVSDVWTRRVAQVLDAADDRGLSQATIFTVALLGGPVSRKRLASLVADGTGSSLGASMAAIQPWVAGEVLAEDADTGEVRFAETHGFESVLERISADDPVCETMLCHLADEAVVGRQSLEPGTLVRIAQALDTPSAKRACGLRLLAAERLIERFDYGIARTALDSAEGAALQMGDRDLAARAAALKAQIHVLEGDLERATACLSTAQGSDEGASTLTATAVARAQAAIYLAAGRQAAAVSTLERALENCDHPVQTSELRLQIADALCQTGELARAERACRTAIAELQEQPGGERSCAQAHRQLATVCRLQGRQDEAGEAARRALVLAERVGARRRVDEALAELLHIASDAGNHDRAAELARQIREQRREFGDRVGVAEAEQLLGELELRRGRVAVAAGHHEAAMSLLGRDGDPRMRAASLVGLSDVYAQAARYDDALHPLEQAHLIYKELGEVGRAAGVTRRMATILRAAKRPVRAERLANDALAYAEGVADEYGAAVSRLVLGLLASDRGAWIQAKPLFTSARESFASLGVYDDLGVTETWLALCESEMGNQMAADMLARDVEHRSSDRPLYRRVQSEALSRLAQSVQPRDQEFAWRLERLSREIDDRLRWRDQ